MAALFCAYVAAPAAGATPAKKKSGKVAHVTVNMTEFQFKLSKDYVPVGTVSFKVVNKGKISHDFKIHGKKTKILAPGKSQVLTVAFKKKATYPYRSTVAGQVAAGMKGILGVGVKIAHVTVSMTEFHFKLSKSQVPVGTVSFKVVNKGKISHDFKIHGKKTKILAPGMSQVLTVTFKKKGSYAYLCTIAGHAAAGMKGILGLGVKPTTPAPVSTPPPTPGSGGGSGGGSPAPATCTSPQTTTVSVDEFEYAFKLSSDSVACGTVTFNQTNTGSIPHNFDLQRVTGGAGSLLNPGASTTMTVTLVPGKYTYICDVQGHAELGMIGTLTVTGG